MDGDSPGVFGWLAQRRGTDAGLSRGGSTGRALVAWRAGVLGGWVEVGVHPGMPCGLVNGGGSCVPAGQIDQSPGS